MQASIPSLTISIPAYNEEAALGGVLEEAHHTLNELEIDGEILVIDDGSRDATAAIAQRWADADRRIRIVRHERNMGFGVTLREIFQLPVKDWIFFVPGDGQIPVREVRPLLARAHESPFLLGWRRDRADPASRRVQAHLYNLVISLVLGRRIHDVDSVVLARRDVVQSITLRARSVFLHAELVLEAERRCVRVLEVPIAHRPRQGGAPQGARPGTILRTIRDVARYVVDRRRRP